MKISEYALKNFEEDQRHFDNTDLLVTVKSFDLLAIRKRYLESRKRNKAGSVERRAPAQGGVVAISIADGKIVKQKILAHITEARGIDVCGEKCVLSSEDKIFLFKDNEAVPVTIEHPWFSYIHTVKFNDDESRLLISSSGLDILFEYDLKSMSILWEWLAWEHGISKGENPEGGGSFVLTRDQEAADRMRAKGEKVKIITKPKEQQLPTALRAAFINSAEYGNKGEVLATQFHAGRVIRIDKSNGTFIPLIDGLTRPHGGMLFKDGYLATDTAGGGVVINSEKELSKFDFSTLPGKPDSARDIEWLQTSHFTD